MNILYITTVFPEIGTSTIYTDLAEALSRTHNVTVVTNIERKKGRDTFLKEERGCRVLRIKTGNQYNVGFIEKGITIISISFLFKRGINKFFGKDKFDLILYEAPPITLEGVIRFAKKKYKAKTYLMLKDIFPQNAVDLNIMKKGSYIYKYFKRIEKKLYANSDYIGCMSKANIEYIQRYNEDVAEKVTYFPNTKKIKPIIKKDRKILEKYGIPTSKTIFIFGGNMGKPQGVEFLANCIKKCEYIEEAHFVLVGRGSERTKVEVILSEVKNATIIDELPRDEYDLLVASCDIGIVSLDYRFTIPNFPSRVLSYMENSMPIFAMTDENSDIKEIIEHVNCGVWCPSKDYDHVIKKVEWFVRCLDKGNMGKNGRVFLEENYDVEISKKIIDDII